MIVQIYEIQTPAEADQMIEQGVDHIGSVILSANGWRDASIMDTVKAIRSAGRKSSLIPLFSDTDLIAEMIEYYRPDIIHFCEMLPPPAADRPLISGMLDRQAVIRRRFPELEIMRSIPIGTTGNESIVASLELAALFEPVSDWFLTDTLICAGDQVKQSDQPVEGYVGITGETCDWTVAAALVSQSNIPVILAGGIGPHNASDGIEQVQPAGVDSCTRTNALDSDGQTIRFKKDVGKVRELVAAARNIDA